jgi:hypothetical protein
MPRKSLQMRPPKTSGHYNTQTTKSKIAAPPTTTSRTRSSSHSRHLALRTTPASPTSTNKLTTPLVPGQIYAKTFNLASKTRQGEHHGNLLQLHQPPPTNTHAPTATRTTGSSFVTAPNAAYAKLPSPRHHSERPTTTHTTATNNPPNALASTCLLTQADLALRQQHHS